MTDGNWSSATGPGFGSPGAPIAGPGAAASNPGYPVTAGLNAPLEVARWRVIGNYILGIPHLVVLYVLNIVAGLAIIAAWFVVLVTAQMPPGLGGFIAGVHRYQWRVGTFLFYLREPYPAFAVPSGYADPGDDPAWLQIVPTAKYSRLAVFFRGLLAIPQEIFAIVLYVGFALAMLVAFFAVLITGRWPEGLRRFVLGVMFWYIRFNAWYTLLTDQYPPFSIG
jgi:hypothetical protein